MYWWERLKGFFKKGVQGLVGEELNTIFEHERIDFDEQEFMRINESFRMYAGSYPDVEYINSMGKETKRKFMHLNMMNEVAKHLGSILFNETCEIVIADAEAKVTIDEQGNRVEEQATNSNIDKEFITHVLEHNNFNKNFSRYVQVMLATGGLAVKPYYDFGTGEFEFSWALAENFIPLHSNTNSISEAVIPTYTQKVVGDKTYFYTLLEFHEWENGSYVITNELYRSEDEDKTGKRVPLEEIYEGLEEKTVFNNLSRPNFVYLKPFGFNNISPESPLGLGVTDNAKATLNQINTAYDQFWWEIKQGKRKVIVSDHFLKDRMDSYGRPIKYFDEETDVFLGLPSGIDDMQHTDITADIRSTQYIESINKFISTLEMQVGLSAGSFTFDGKSVKTATEVVSENSMTYRTRNSHLTNIEQFIQELIISLCELASETYDENGQPLYKGEVPSKEDIGVDFDDGVFQNKDAMLNYYGRAVQMGLMPSYKAIQEVFKLSEEDSIKWYQSITNERRGANPLEQQDKVEEELFGSME